MNGQDQRGVRGSLRWAPRDGVVASVTLTYDGQRNPGTAFRSRAQAPTGGNRGDFSYAELSGSPFSAQVLGARKLGLKRDVYDANFTLTAELSPGITFTTVNGYRKFDSNEVFDADGGPAWYLEFAEDARGDQYSHESRFNFEGAKYRAAFGWNAFAENNLQRVPFSTEEGTYLTCVGALPAATRAALAAAGIPSGPGCVLPNGTVAAARTTAILTAGTATQLPYSSVFTNFGTNDTYSVFADGTFIPTPRLELTAGARILIERRKSGYSSVQPNAVLAGVSLLPTVSTGGAKFTAQRSFTAVLPRFNALFRLSDAINLYGTVSKGRRSPIVQLSAARVAGVAVPNLQVVPEEIVWNYEGGIKGRVGAFSGSLGIFYQEYNGFQVTVTSAAGATTTQSAGKARNPGVEAEGSLRLGQHVSLFANYAYVDGKIATDATYGVYSGARFRLQPQHSAAGGATHSASRQGG